MRGATSRAPTQVVPCTCAKSLVSSDREKLVVLHRMEEHQKQLVELKREKLRVLQVQHEEMMAHKRQELALTERILMVQEARFLLQAPPIFPQGR